MEENLVQQRAVEGGDGGEGVGMTGRAVGRGVCLLLLAPVSALLLPSYAAARQPARTAPPFVLTKGSELAAAVNVPDKNLKLAGALFLPSSARSIRAVLVVMKNVETEAHMLTGENPYSVWHAAAESLSCALLHLRVNPIRAPEPGPRPPESDPVRNAATGSGDGLLELMRRFAVESGRPEIADAPFLFWGWSAAAGFGPSFARLHPHRTVGFIRYHSHLRGLPLDFQTAREIPALIFVGGEDDPTLAQDSISLFRQGRSFGAPWAILIQPGVPHQIRAADIAAASPLTMAWITAVVNARIGGSARLRAMSSEEAWFGDSETGAISRAGPPEKGDQSWLPDEPTALAWKAVATLRK